MKVYRLEVSKQLIIGAIAETLHEEGAFKVITSDLGYQVGDRVDLVEEKHKEDHHHMWIREKSDVDDLKGFCRLHLTSEDPEDFELED